MDKPHFLIVYNSDVSFIQLNETSWSLWGKKTIFEGQDWSISLSSFPHSENLMNLNSSGIFYTQTANFRFWEIEERTSNDRVLSKSSFATHNNTDGQSHVWLFIQNTSYKLYNTLMWQELSLWVVTQRKQLKKCLSKVFECWNWCCQQRQRMLLCVLIVTLQHSFSLLNCCAYSYLVKSFDSVLRDEGPYFLELSREYLPASSLSLSLCLSLSLFPCVYLQTSLYVFCVFFLFLSCVFSSCHVCDDEMIYDVYVSGCVHYHWNLNLLDVYVFLTEIANEKVIYLEEWCHWDSKLSVRESACSMNYHLQSECHCGIEMQSVPLWNYNKNKEILELEHFDSEQQCVLFT